MSLGKSSTEKEEHLFFDPEGLISESSRVLQYIEDYEKEDITDQFFQSEFNDTQRQDLSYSQTNLEPYDISETKEEQQPTVKQKPKKHTESNSYNIQGFTFNQYERVNEFKSLPLKAVQREDDVDDNIIPKTDYGIRHTNKYLVHNSPTRVGTNLSMPFTTPGLLATPDYRDYSTSSSEGFSLKRKYESTNLERNVSYLNITQDGQQRVLSVRQSPPRQTNTPKKDTGSPSMANSESYKKNSSRKTPERSEGKFIPPAPIERNSYRQSPRNGNQSSTASIYKNHASFDESIRENKYESFPGYESSYLEAPSLPRYKEDVTVNGTKYEVLKFVGEGASGKVYLVFSDKHRVIFALKWVTIKSSEELEKVKNEIEIMRSLNNSDHIVSLLDHEITPQVVYMIMEYGTMDFSRLIHLRLKRKWDITFIKYYWKQMLLAVHVTHEHDIIHSDLKPANFIVVGGDLKLIDFGIAAVIPDYTMNIGRESQLGTRNFMAPETFIDKDGELGYKLGRASDIWSLGCILYQMIYAKPPFFNVPKTVVHKAITDRNHQILFPENAVYGGETIQVPKILLDLLKMCLNRNSNLRPSMKELLDHEFVNL